MRYVVLESSDPESPIIGRIETLFEGAVVLGELLDGTRVMRRVTIRETANAIRNAYTQRIMSPPAGAA